MNSHSHMSCKRKSFDTAYTAETPNMKTIESAPVLRVQFVLLESYMIILKRPRIAFVIECVVVKCRIYGYCIIVCFSIYC